MAVMHPRALLPADCKSRAEAKVFAALERELSDEWLVFHSASLVVRDPAAGAVDDECDFVLCHPEHGVVCLEVKGGGIECRHGTWFRPPDAVPIKDPFTQALDHSHNVRRKFGEAGGSKRPRMHVVHAVAFPDITVHELALAPDAPREILWDRNDIRDAAAAALERTLTYHRGARDKRVMPDPSFVRKVLAPEVAIKVPMAEEFLDEEEALVILTSEQAGLVARHWRTPLMAVHGCAGSGKTMIAVERAKQLARRGEDVLFVCFNKQLAQYLRRKERHDRITFQTFHGLCTHLASRAAIKLPQHPADNTPQDFFKLELPAALLDAVKVLGPQYDALIVDEAQDLEVDWLEVLTATLRDPEADSIWLFLDDNQRVYEAELTIPDGFLHYDLTVNCRNTQSIHREVMAYYDGDIDFEVTGPEGRDVVRWQGDDVGKALRTTLDFLVDKEEVLPQDIVVLSSHALERSEVARGVNGRFVLTPERGKLGNRIHFSSIRSFKGLESPVVVLVETEDLDEATRDQQMYVAISRARNHCVILERG